jgi:tungstate transport system substrate-binding protein
MLSDRVVDLAITHAPAAESRYLLANPEWRYSKFAFNRFVVVGPREDPAKVRHASDAVEAFRLIAASPMTFVSRGDQSGTHEREVALWRAAAARPSEDHLVLTRLTMASTLEYADERQAYALSDEATFRQMQRTLDLVVLMSDDARLLNTYAMVYSTANVLAVEFAEWLTTGNGRERLAGYTIDGVPAFITWPDGCPADQPHLQPCSPPTGR